MSARRKLSPTEGAVLGAGLMFAALALTGANPAAEEASAQRVLRRFAPGLLLSSTDGYVLTFDSATGTWGGEAAAGGGNETLAQTLALGSVTGGTDLAVTTGDEITSANELILRAASDARMFAQNGDVRLATSNDTGAHSMLVRLTGGDAATAGSMLVDAGEGTTTGGPVQILAGGGTGGAGVGGSVELVAGASAASTAGDVRLAAGDAPTDGIVDVEARLLQVADRAGTGPGVISSVAGQDLTVQAGAAFVATATTTATYGAGTFAYVRAGDDPQNVDVTGARIFLDPGASSEGGDANMLGGDGDAGDGGSVLLQAGNSNTATGGSPEIVAGSGGAADGTVIVRGATSFRNRAGSGAGSVAPLASYSIATTGLTVPVVATGRWLGQDESGAVCVAATDQTYTLRSSLVAGTVYTFVNGALGDDFTVQTSGGDVIHWSGGTSPDTSIVSSTAGSKLVLVYVGSGIWRATLEFGTLAGS